MLRNVLALVAGIAAWVVTSTLLRSVVYASAVGAFVAGVITVKPRWLFAALAGMIPTFCYALFWSFWMRLFGPYMERGIEGLMAVAVGLTVLAMGAAGTAVGAGAAELIAWAMRRRVTPVGN